MAVDSRVDSQLGKSATGPPISCRGSPVFPPSAKLGDPWRRRMGVARSGSWDFWALRFGILGLRTGGLLCAWPGILVSPCRLCVCSSPHAVHSIKSTARGI